jgi:pimeloyl-ACP methyl ester carboxylesterase
MNTIIKQRILLALFGIVFLFTVLTGSEPPENLLYLNNYRFVTKIPENHSTQIVIISNRFFNQKQDSILEKGVDPGRKMSYFVASLENDSIYIIPFKKMDDVLKTFFKNRDFLIFVNGYGKNFGQNLFRGLEIDNRYNLNVIIFDWPSDYKPVRKSAYFAKKVTGNLVHLIDTFNLIHKECFKGTTATLIFHSMGNHIARNMATKLPATAINHHIFDNVVLNAAGVTQFHHAKWVEKLKMQDRVYINSNKGDKTLKLLELARLSTQLGLKAKKPLADNAIYVDFSLIAGEDHNYFIGRSIVEKVDPGVYNYFNAVFHGKQVNLNDTLTFRPKEKGLGFYIY